MPSTRQKNGHKKGEVPEEEIDEVPTEAEQGGDEAPPLPSQRTTRRSTRNARNIRVPNHDDSISASTVDSGRSKKRRISPINPDSAGKRARAVDEPDPYGDDDSRGTATTQAQQTFPRSTTITTESVIDFKGAKASDAARQITEDNGTSAQADDDVEMDESVEKQEHENTLSSYLADDAGVVLNGVHHSSTSTTNDFPAHKAEMKSHGDQVAVPKSVAEVATTATTHPQPLPFRAPPMDRLRLPSQHTPGKLNETKIIREQGTIPLPHQHDFQHMELPQSNGVMPQLNISENPTESGSLLYSTTQSLVQDEKTDAAQETPREQNATYLYDKNVMVEEGSEPEAPLPPRTFSLWRLPLFWFLSILLLQFVYTQYWINPFMLSVVAGSKSLTAFYKEMVRFESVPSDLEPISALVNTSTNDNDVEGSLLLGNRAEHETVLAIAEPPNEKFMVEIAEPKPPRVNQTLVEEKQRLREINMIIAEQNIEIERENARRRELNSQRVQQMDDLLASNQRVQMENSNILDEITELEALLREIKETKSSTGQSLDALSAQVQSLTGQYDKLRAELPLLTRSVAKKHHQASQDLSFARSLVSDRLQISAELHKVLTSIADSSDFADKTNEIANARSILGDSEDLLLDIFSFEMWKPSVASLDCKIPHVAVAFEAEESSNLRSALKVETLTSLLDEFRNEIFKEIEDAQQNEELIEYVQSLVAGMADDFPLDELLADAPELPKPIVKTTPSGLSTDDIKHLVSSRTALEQADRTGRVDYASLFNGAEIIHSATSPSFVETLPILNRIGALLSLRSYGYGPEAALTPTWPMNSLGQCWAFQRDGAADSDDEPRRFGRFADLAIRFARPVPVVSVSIEHPPLELSNRPMSAIKQFQVIGFEQMDASGDPWHLGTFMYDIRDRRKSARQEFKVSRQFDGPDDVPDFGSIILAIDSNWGEQVSCLYRFRVHNTAEY
ncbi:hypothetical protein ACA910_011008 [Epithemia clementina (nom. ined.)]